MSDKTIDRLTERAGPEDRPQDDEEIDREEYEKWQQEEERKKESEPPWNAETARLQKGGTFGT